MRWLLLLASCVPPRPVGHLHDPDHDFDGDGFTERDNDCDDSDPTVSPVGFDWCLDDIDSDCDGEHLDCTVEVNATDPEEIRAWGFGRDVTISTRGILWIGSDTRVITRIDLTTGDRSELSLPESQEEPFSGYHATAYDLGRYQEDLIAASTRASGGALFFLPDSATGEVDPSTPSFTGVPLDSFQNAAVFQDGNLQLAITVHKPPKLGALYFQDVLPTEPSSIDCGITGTECTFFEELPTPEDNFNFGAQLIDGEQLDGATGELVISATAIVAGPQNLGIVYRLPYADQGDTIETEPAYTTGMGVDLQPDFARFPFGDGHRLMVAYPNGFIRLYDSEDEIAVHDFSVGMGRSLEVIERDEGPALAASGYHLFGVNPETGQALWRDNNVGEVLEDVGDATDVAAWEDPNWSRGSFVVSDATQGVVHFIRVPTEYDDLP